MTNMLGQDVWLCGPAGLSLARVFRPIAHDLEVAQERLTATLTGVHDPSVREIIDFLLESPGKRIRPALVLLSARAAYGGTDGLFGAGHPAVAVAAAVEVIHMASLIHDDLIDGASLRHQRPSVHMKWGKRIAVAVGDFLCASAFRLVADCADPRLFAILGSQLCEMCHGEIQQVVGRGDFRLSERHCLAMAEKKTAALFGACCGAGAATAGSSPGTWKACQKFGFHFGVVFQILDDCRDLLGDQEELGKTPGQDLLAGDATLPLVRVVSYCGRKHGHSLQWSRHALTGPGLAQLRAVFHSSPAPARITALIASHVRRARQAIECLAGSDFKDSLHRLVDDVVPATSRILMR